MTVICRCQNPSWLIYCLTMWWCKYLILGEKTEVTNLDLLKQEVFPYPCFCQNNEYLVITCNKTFSTNKTDMPGYVDTNAFQSEQNKFWALHVNEVLENQDALFPTKLKTLTLNAVALSCSRDFNRNQQITRKHPAHCDFLSKWDGIKWKQHQVI